jgi:hypothetical protein
MLLITKARPGQLHRYKVKFCKTSLLSSTESDLTEADMLFPAMLSDLIVQLRSHDQTFCGFRIIISGGFILKLYVSWLSIHVELCGASCMLYR